MSRGAFAVLPALLVLAGCAAPPPAGPLDFLRNDQHHISNPGEAGAAATGRGCAISAKVAETHARRTAEFNLLSMMGPGNYQMRFTILHRTEEPERVCYEVEALVVD